MGTHSQHVLKSHCLRRRPFTECTQPVSATQSEVCATDLCSAHPSISLPLPRQFHGARQRRRRVPECWLFNLFLPSSSYSTSYRHGATQEQRGRCCCCCSWAGGGGRTGEHSVEGSGSQRKRQRQGCSGGQGARRTPAHATESRGCSSGPHCRCSGIHPP